MPNEQSTKCRLSLWSSDESTAVFIYLQYYEPSVAIFLEKG